MCDFDLNGKPGQTRDQATIDAVMPALYTELRRLAQACLARERPDHTLQPTALVHEAYLRLASQYNLDWSCKAQVMGLAATMMRRILVNYSQTRSALKRDGGIRVPLDEALEQIEGGDLDVQQIDSALSRLGEVDPRQERIVELRFFSGLTVEETASTLELSPATVKREWRTARLWLLRELGRSPG